MVAAPTLLRPEWVLGRRAVLCFAGPRGVLVAFRPFVVSALPPPALRAAVPFVLRDVFFAARFWETIDAMREFKWAAFGGEANVVRAERRPCPVSPPLRSRAEGARAGLTGITKEPWPGLAASGKCFAIS